MLSQQCDSGIHFLVVKMLYEYNLEISDLVIRIGSSRAICFSDCFQAFLADADPSGVPDVFVEVHYYENIQIKKGERLAENIWQEGDKYIQRYCLREQEYLYRIEYIGRKEYCLLEVPESFADSFCNKGNLLLYLSMDRLLLPFRRIILHASAVIDQGKAYVFAAPSGGGKSTHASLWEKYRGAEILNGDKVIIEAGPDGCTAYGSPVAGSSGIYKKKGASVAAIIFLEIGSQNIARTEIKHKGYLKLYSGLIKSMWDEDYNCHLLELAETVIRTTPVVSLVCKADRGAVECVKDHLERMQK